MIFNENSYFCKGFRRKFREYFGCFKLSLQNIETRFSDTARDKSKTQSPVLTHPSTADWVLVLVRVWLGLHLLAALRGGNHLAGQTAISRVPGHTLLNTLLGVNFIQLFFWNYKIIFRQSNPNNRLNQIIYQSMTWFLGTITRQSRE